MGLYKKVFIAVVLFIASVIHYEIALAYKAYKLLPEVNEEGLHEKIFLDRYGLILWYD